MFKQWIYEIIGFIIGFSVGIIGFILSKVANLDKHSKMFWVVIAFELVISGVTGFIVFIISRNYIQLESIIPGILAGIVGWLTVSVLDTLLTYLISKAKMMKS